MMKMIKQIMVRCINIYCGTLDKITQHHLIPKPYRKGIIGRIGRVYLCEDCHKKVHRMRTNGELAEHYSTKDAIIKLLASDAKFRVQRMMDVMSTNSQYSAVA